MKRHRYEEYKNYNKNNIAEGRFVKKYKSYDDDMREHEESIMQKYGRIIKNIVNIELNMDIIAMIIDLVEPKFSLRLVCKTWHDYIKNNLTDITVIGKHVKSVYNLFPNIKKLKIYDRYDNINIKKFARLQKIKLFDIDMSLVKRINCNLRKCHIYIHKIDVCLRDFLDRINDYNHLDKLTINNKKGYCALCLTNYENLCNIKKLKLYKFNGFSNELLFSICKNTALKTLILRDIKYNVGKFMLESFAAIDKADMQLHLYRADFSESQIKYLTDHVKMLKWR